jgi:hypothetical protein
MSNEGKPFDTIQGAWIEWLELFVPKTASVQNVGFIRHTFWAGASAMFAILNDMVKDKLPKEEAREKFIELSKEIHQYFESIK